MKRPSPFLLVMLLIPFVASTVTGADWTRFRGAGGLGVSTDSESLPTTWSDTENVQWKAALPGPGSSSPIVLGDRVYVTSYSGVKEESVDSLKRHLICVDRGTGEIVWETKVEADQPEDPYRGFITQHGYASHTPVTDGKRLYVFMGKSGIRAFDLDGTVGFADFLILSTNYGQGGDFTSGGVAALPEPKSVALVLLGIVCLCRTRQKRTVLGMSARS